MIRNTLLISVSFFSVYVISFISNELNEHYKESLNDMTIYIVKSISSFSRVLSVMVLLIYLIIVLLEIRYDKTEFFILAAVGFTRKQIVKYGMFKYITQLLISILFALLFSCVVSIIVTKAFSLHGTLLSRAFLYPAEDP